MYFAVAMYLFDEKYIKQHFFTENFRLSQMSIIKIYLNYAMTKEILEEKINGLKVEISEKTVNSLFEEAKETVTLPEQTTAS